MSQSLFLALSLIFSAVRAQAMDYVLTPGMSMTIGRDTVSCQTSAYPGGGGGGGGGYSSRGDTCLINFANNAYHVYAIKNGSTQVLGYWSGLDEAIGKFGQFQAAGLCSNSPRRAAECSIVFVNNAHHVYMDTPGAAQTLVGWWSNVDEALNLMGRLRSLNICR